MKNVFTIAGREIRSSFVTPLAYIIVASFMVVAGFFFFTWLGQYNDIVQRVVEFHSGERSSLNEIVITPYYQTIEIILVFLLPVLTMRSIADEKRTGTFELLVTSPVTPREIVWGKFLGIVCVLMVMLGFAFVFPACLMVFAEPEIAPTIVGIPGLLLFGMSFAAIGIAVSAFTKSQTAAGVVSLVIMLVFYVLDAPADRFYAGVGKVLLYIAPATHSAPFLKGVFEGADIIYFISLTVLGLFVATRALETEHWR